MQCFSREVHESVLYPNHFCIGFEYEVIGPASVVGMTETDIHIAACIPGVFGLRKSSESRNSRAGSVPICAR